VKSLDGPKTSGSSGRPRPSVRFAYHCSMCTVTYTDDTGSLDHRRCEAGNCEGYLVLDGEDKPTVQPIKAVQTIRPRGRGPVKPEPPKTAQQLAEDKTFDEGLKQFESRREKNYEAELARLSKPVSSQNTPTVQPIQAVQNIVKVPSSPNPSGSSSSTNQSFATDKTSRPETPVRTAHQSVPQQEPKRPAVLDSRPTSSVKVSTGLVPQSTSSSQELASSSKTKTFMCVKCKKEICRGDPWIKYDNKFLMHTKCHRCRICFESFPQEDNTSDEHPTCSAKQAAASTLKSIKGKFW